MRAVLLYAGLSALAIAAIAAALLGLLLTTPGDRAAVWISAAVAFPVQVAAFAVARLMARSGQGIAGWGLGAVASIVTLVVFGFIVRGTALPPGTALVSLAAFLFATELIEPPLLNV